MLVAAVAAMSLAAVTAGTASASTLSARFSPASEFYIKAPTGVTIKKNGGSALSCTMATVIAGPSGTGFFGSNEPNLGLKFNCGISGSLVMRFQGHEYYDTVTGRYWLQVEDFTVNTLGSPWGNYWQESSGLDQWTWVNGSGTTPSTITLNEVRVGHTVGGENITISGSLTATTTSGGLITLVH
ncbi:MAG TPA: hypothetical protein VFN85_11400 [Solirubrobacterales bacterium]|nr:hypothetical protein [Solirubrobacterales bacterium]